MLVTGWLCSLKKKTFLCLFCRIFIFLSFFLPLSTNHKKIYTIDEVVPVFPCLSLPAKSTKFNLAFFKCCLPPGSVYMTFSQTVKMACDLEEWTFMVVAEVILLEMPIRSNSAQWPTVSTLWIVKSANNKQVLRELHCSGLCTHWWARVSTSGPMVIQWTPLIVAIVGPGLIGHLGNRLQWPQYPMALIFLEYSNKLWGLI